MTLWSSVSSAVSASIFSLSGLQTIKAIRKYEQSGARPDRKLQLTNALEFGRSRDRQNEQSYLPEREDTEQGRQLRWSSPIWLCLGEDSGIAPSPISKLPEVLWRLWQVVTRRVGPFWLCVWVIVEFAYDRETCKMNISFIGKQKYAYRGSLIYW